MSNVLRHVLAVVVPTAVTLILCLTGNNPGPIAGALIGFFGSMGLYMVLPVKTESKVA